MYRSILIATDGSPTAGEAARVGAGVARATGAQAILLHVGDAEVGARMLEQAARALGDGLTVRTVTEQGDPADRILDVAEREGCDLIVVGNKGMTGAQRFLLGNVPNRVSHHAPCNVLIVKTT